MIEQFAHHPVVATALRAGIRGYNIVMIYLYWDGVQYNKKDTFLGIFMKNILTGKATLLCVLRKEDVCKCGCRGWCSQYPILHELATDLIRNANTAERCR